MIFTAHKLMESANLATFAGYLFGSERDATKYQNAQYGYLDEEELSALARDDGRERLTAKDSIIHYLNQNRWSIIGEFCPSGTFNIWSFIHI
jgi:hypothetical protein